LSTAAANSSDPQLSRADDRIAGIEGNSPRGGCRESCESAKPAILNSNDGIVGDSARCVIRRRGRSAMGSVASLMAT
jgi:hypothetical protein